MVRNLGHNILNKTKLGKFLSCQSTMNLAKLEGLEMIPHNSPHLSKYPTQVVQFSRRVQVPYLEANIVIYENLFFLISTEFYYEKK